MGGIALRDGTLIVDREPNNSLFEESLSNPELERWVRKLGAEDNYERLKRA